MSKTEVLGLNYFWVAICIAGYMAALSVFSIAQSSDETKSGIRVTEAFAPQYPRVPLAAQIQGTVRIRIQVMQNGAVQHAEAISGSPALAPVALEAAKKWRFTGGGQQALELEFRFEALARDAPKDAIGAVFMPPLGVLVRDRVPVIPDRP